MGGEAYILNEHGEATGHINVRLADLVKRAELSALAPSTNKRNKALLKELCFALVALAQLVASQQAEMAEKPRVLVP